MKENVVILSVEDDAGHFTLMKRNLARASLPNQVLNFRDGQEILDFFAGKTGSPRFNPRTPYVLLLDIRMPKVDGVEVLRRIKGDVELRKIPVIMLTTTDDPSEINRCYSLGCSFYIVKPADYVEFMNAVERLGKFLSLPTVQIAAPAID
ncbi:MAG TPA: response regulator [Sedimentisphaerales bacterium]|nr:response regulator [Sedimentisphaerales bacterium]